MKKVLSSLMIFVLVLSIYAVVPQPFCAAESSDYEYQTQDNGTAIITKYIGSGSKIVIPSTLDGHTVTTIGVGAFRDCSALMSVILPNTISKIDNFAFERCSGLEKIEFQSSITSIGVASFRGCTSLTSVNIPASTIEIGSGAFMACSGLMSLTVDPGNKRFDSRDDCNAIIETRYNKLLFGCKATVIPDSITSIGDSAFYYCTELTEITIPDSVTIIGSHSFNNCTSIKSVIIPSSVTSIGDSAFYGCTALASVILPDSVGSISYRAFFGCKNLSSITIQKSCYSITTEALGYYSENGEYNTKRIEQFTIFGYEGSKADDYAYENYFDFIKLTKKTDVNTNISLDLPDDRDYIVNPLTDYETVNVANGLHTTNRIIAAYDIEVIKDGSAIQPDNVVKINIPCINESARIYRKDKTGSFTDMNAICKDGYLVYYTDKLGRFVVTEEEKISSGDVDSDGEVTIIDATLIQRHLAEIPVYAYNEAAADTDGDGEVTIIDATCIQRYLVQLPAPERIGKPIT